MALNFAGRVEAKIVVPTGGAAVSASNAGGGPTTVTVPAGSYYLTSAGGVSSLIDELESQLNTSRPPSSGSWTVAVDTSGGTGRVTISCDEPASVSFTSTTLRDVLGFDRNFDYPTSSSVTGTMVGGGAWAAGYLCNESSGDLSAAFGGPATLAVTGALTYSITGARGGNDKAIQFTGGGNQFFDGGNVFDVGASDDLVLAWVGYLTGALTTNATTFSKTAGGFANGWAVTAAGANSLSFYAGAGAAFTTSCTTTGLTGQFHVGLAVIDRSTGKMRIGIQSLSSGTQALSSEATITGSISTAGTFRVGASPWTFVAESAMRISAFYIGSGAGYGTGLSTGMSTALSTFATYMKSQTGAESSEAVFFPDCPLMMESDPYQAPMATDLRSTESPTGGLISNVGNSKYRHRDLVYSHVPKERVWESAATYANQSWESFAKKTQLGQGSSWFLPSSAVQIYWNNAGTQTLVGGAYNSAAGVSGWKIKGLNSVEPRQSIAGWSGQFRIEFAEIVSEG